MYRFAMVMLPGLLTGCRSDPAPVVVPAQEYVPLETGRYVIYDVREQRYALNTSPLQWKYQLKEVVGRAYPDVTGQPAWPLIRYRRSADSQPWQADSVWSARLVNNELIRTENGLDFVKLIVPVTDQLRWDGNRHNPLGNDTYTMRNSGRRYHVSDKEFDDTVTVDEQNDSTLVSQDKRVAVYARRVGLVYKERTQLQFCTATPACIGTYQIAYGIRQIYQIRAYGTE